MRARDSAVVKLTSRKGVPFHGMTGRDGRVLIRVGLLRNNAEEHGADTRGRYRAAPKTRLKTNRIGNPNRDALPFIIETPPRQSRGCEARPETRAGVGGGDAVFIDDREEARSPSARGPSC